MKKPLIMSLAIVAISAIGLSSNVAMALTGEQLFKDCERCHTIEFGGRNKRGPNLNGVVGRAAGSVRNFRYSPALLESGLIWDEPTLDQWLNNPKEFLKGTKMKYWGLKNAEDRAAVIEYLKSSAVKTRF
ncbi:MAG: cytochrome c family protein [Planctomycetota bacterium]|nr:cytochrome c family protein [Planctomycetota bacterium]